MHSAILLLFINFFKSAQPAVLSRSNACKPLVTSPDWPSPESWRSLNDSVSGNLLAPFPPSIVCDSSRPQSFDPVACAQVGQSWYKSGFHRDDPVSVTYPNWQNDACLPTAVYNATIGCDLGPYPRYVVNATKASHIVETVNFAITTGVRLIVKGGAHDLLGRSTAPSSLSIWTRYFLGISFDPSFLPSSCPDKLGVKAVTVASGHRMSEIYDAVAVRNLTIVGGADPNVGLGGYLTGGGHGPLGSKYGLAVDNVLEMSLVTPEGDTITANACQNEDYFWAMKGGGGSTFGVLINATLQTYPIPMVTPAFLAFNSTALEASQNGNTNFFSAVAYLQTQLPSLSTSGLMGYFSMTPLSESNTSSPMNFDFLIYALSPSPSALENPVRPVMDQLSLITGITPLLDVKQTVDFTTFRTTYLTAATVGSNYLGGNRLWDTKAVGDRKATATALKAFEKGYLEGTFESGPGVQIVAANQSSVNPVWRQTVVEMMTRVSYPFKSSRAQVAAAQQSANALTKVLRDQAPDTGCYLNEASIDEPDYQHAFWGDHYSSLLSFKRKVDSAGVFWCKVCVGGEDWSEDSTGKLCRM